MTKHENIFSGDTTGDGVKWMGTCAIMAGVVGAGWSANQLAYACLASIAILALLLGILPYFRTMNILRAKKRACRLTIHASDLIQHILSLIHI